MQHDKLASAAFATLLLAASNAGAPANAAAAKTIDMASLRKMVNGLGLADRSDNNTFIKVENQGSRGLTIDYQPLRTVPTSWSTPRSSTCPTTKWR